MKLALGTAQFGLNYGVANATGKVSDTELAAILSEARMAGIDTLDTAVAYGDSEARLGQAGVSDLNIVSKLPPLDPANGPVADQVSQLAEQSRRRLGIDQLHGLLLHNAGDLAGENGAAIYEALDNLRRSGAVVKIGVSIYNPEDLDAMPPNYRLDLVQAPFNVLDRRLVASGWLTKLREAGAEVHVRSVFLQGLLLMRESERPAYFARWAGLFRRWSDWLGQSGYTPAEGAMAGVLHTDGIERLVIGVDTSSQLTEIVRAFGRAKEGPAAPDFSAMEPQLINPNLWRMP